VGSIIRTTEAFRLGEIHFSEKTPYIDHPKIAKSAMGCDLLVPCHQNSSLSSLKRPFIALETTDYSSSLYDYVFPPSFTLFLGNEEFGLSEKNLKEADVVLEIPLWGSKNSLNVASAFAIAAFEVRRAADKHS
jgi:tRNA G18 (ribose-2'-O)-methylase SpoU